MPFPVTLELPESVGTLRFRTVEELLGYVAKEHEAYSWLSGINNQLQNTGTNTSFIVQRLNQFNQIIQNIRQRFGENNVDAGIGLFQSYFSGNLLFPPSESINGQMIKAVRSELGDAAAYAALATLLGGAINSSDPKQIQGVLAAHEVITNTGKAARQSVQTALSSLLKRLSEQQLHAEETADALDNRIERIERRSRSHFDRALRSGKQARLTFEADIQASISRINDSVNKSISAISAVQQTFEEHMRLEAPVKYWEKKAATHKTNARIAAAVGIIYAIAVVGYASLYGISHVLDLVKKLTDETHQWQSAYVVLTLILFLLTIAFWIGRLVSRTYVSQTHLAIDAEERATMVETYLALTKDNQIGPDERILVLGSLFRASSDGLVRDDGAPDLSLAGIASRIGSSTK